MTNEHVCITHTFAQFTQLTKFTQFTKHMTIKTDLKNFYDAEAKKYASTRKKHRSDADAILEEIKKSGEKTIAILEFGCGSGRLLDHLKTLKGIKINYIGVDISKELLQIAEKETKKEKITNIHCTFICDDIYNYVKTCKQEEFDLIVGIASFQHIPTTKEKIFLMKNFYRMLRYEGKLIMTNRALSLRFLKKHKIQIMKSRLEYFMSLGKRSRRDVMVPRTPTNESSSTNPNPSATCVPRSATLYRFYHLFSLEELERLTDVSGFTREQLTYRNQDGEAITSRTKANNSFLVAKKDVFITV
jgi:ubiquinone/menaquinone biosynthesis C-methylase UbiE